MSLDVMLEKISTIIGKMMEIQNCQIRGQVSQDSRYWMKNHRMDTWSGERLTRKHTTSRPDTMWPEIWKDMSETSKRREKQKWAIEKPKLDNARKLRGIYFIEPADAELKETLGEARRKLEVPMPAALPCKITARKYKETCRTPDIRKTKYACIVEAGESTRKCGRTSS